MAQRHGEPGRGGQPSHGRTRRPCGIPATVRRPVPRHVSNEGQTRCRRNLRGVRCNPRVRTVTSSAIHDVTARGAGGLPVAPTGGCGRRSAAWMASLVAGVSSGSRLCARVLTALCLVCTVLPLLHIAGEGPRGVEIRSVLAASTRLPVSDAGNRPASTPVDADDVHEDVVPPRTASLATRVARRPVLPGSEGAFSTRGGSPLDRPPRFADVG